MASGRASTVGKTRGGARSFSTPVRIKRWGRLPRFERLRRLMDDPTTLYRYELFLLGTNPKARICLLLRRVKYLCRLWPAFPVLRAIGSGSARRWDLHKACSTLSW